MEWSEVDASACSVTRTMDLLGDRWTVLVLRDIFNGVRRFADIQTHLGVSRSVLSQRLRDLLAAGVLERREYQEPGERARHEYRLSAMGRDLQVILQALMNYGDRWLTDAQPVLVVRHRGCDAAVRAATVCEAGHVVEEPRDLYRAPGPHYDELSVGVVAARG